MWRSLGVTVRRMGGWVLRTLLGDWMTQRIRAWACRRGWVAAPTPKPEPVALTVSGAVENELALSLADLEAMPVIKISAEFKGETAEYEGVTLKDILDRAGVSSGASSLTLTAADDYSKDVDYAEVQACAECIVVFDHDAGYLRMVMPGLSTGAWIKDVVRIEVK